MTDRMQTIQGRCPACNGASLFLGSGGHVTCSRLDCPNPSAADELLHGDHAAKVADLERQLAALRQVARGYCAACGRGDAAPTVADWEQQRQRAEMAAQHLRAAEFTARHWHQAALGSGHIPFVHAIACISAAIGGQTDPNQLGLDEAVHDAFRDALDQPAPADHVYLSTGCFHGDHDYCKAMTGLSGAKRPAECKKCGAKCICPCHREQPDV